MKRILLIVALLVSTSVFAGDQNQDLAALRDKVCSAWGKIAVDTFKLPRLDQDTINQEVEWLVNGYEAGPFAKDVVRKILTRAMNDPLTEAEFDVYVEGWSTCQQFFTILTNDTR